MSCASALASSHADPTSSDPAPHGPPAATLATKSFAVRGTREGAMHRLTPYGELDLATAPIFEREFDAVLPDREVEMIVIDLTRLAFMDSSGIHLLRRMKALCEKGDRLRVINGSRAVERILDISGVRDRLPMISATQNPLAPL